MAFKKINGDEQCVNDKTFLSLHNIDGKYYLRTTDGDIEISVETFDSLKEGKVNMNGVVYYNTKKIARAWNDGDKHVVEFVNGERLPIDSTTFSSIVGCNDFYSLSGIYYQKELIKKVNRVEIVKGDEEYLGTPIEVDKTYGGTIPIYFNTKLPELEINKWLQSLHYEPQEQTDYLFCILAEDSDSYHNIAAMYDAENDNYFIYPAGSIVDNIQIYSSKGDEGFDLPQGWIDSIEVGGFKWNKETGELIYDSQISYDYESFNHNEKWNGIMVSETEFEHTGTPSVYKYLAILTNGNQFEISEDEYNAIANPV